MLFRSRIPPSAPRLLVHGVAPEQASRVLSRLTALSRNVDIPHLGQRSLGEAVTALTFRQRIHESMKESR